VFHSQSRLSTTAIAIFFLIFFATIALNTYAYSLLILSLIAIWAIMGMSWNVIGGYVGLVSFGQAAFFGLGAFEVVVLAHDYNVSPWLSLPLSGVIGGVSALIIGGVSLRLREFYFALASLAFPLALLYLVEWAGYVELAVPIHRERPWGYMQFEDPRGLPFVAAILMLLAFLASFAIERSRFGLKLVAIRQDEMAAKAAGIRTFREKLLATAISGVMGGLAGGMYALVILVVTPSSVFGMTISAQAIIISMFGGRGTAWGAVLGAVLLVPLSELLNSYFGSMLPGIAGVVYGFAIIFVVLTFPQGLYWSMLDAARKFRRAKSTTMPMVANVEALPITRPTKSNGVLLDVQDVSVQYGGVRALQNVSLSVAAGEIVGIIGPNGAGKTTLFNVFSGIQQPTSGEVIFDGDDTVGKGPDAICELGVGRTFQTVRAFPRLTLLENVVVGSFVRFAADRDALAQAWSVLERVGLRERAGALGSELNNRELRLMELARALASVPKIILLDECLAGLTAEDIEHMIVVLRELRKDNLTIIIIEHTVDAVARLVDRIIVLNYGSVICSGMPAQVLKNEEVITAYLGKRWAAHAKG